jgi:NTE family protein
MTDVPPASGRTRVLSLSGGGGNGAAQAAAVLDLLESGYVPDMYVGTSIGAWNAAYLASHPGVKGARQLVELWRDGTMRMMAAPQPLHAIGGLLGRHGGLSGPRGGERVLAVTGLMETRFEDLATPLVLGAVDAETFELRYWGGEGAEGAVAPLVLASSALPPIFDPVEIEGREMIDAGLVDNCALPEITRRLGGRPADITVVDAAPMSTSTPPHSVGQSLIAGLGAIFRGQRERGIEVAEAAGHSVSVIEVGSGSILDFAHPAVGIAFGRSAARTWRRGHEASAPDSGLAV